MTKHLLVLLLALFCIYASACVTEYTDEDGDPIVNPEDVPPNEDLPLNGDGLLIAAASHIEGPTAITINKRNPKVLNFIGVVGPSKDTHPELHAEAILYLWEHIGQRQELFIRLRKGTSPKSKVLYGTVMLRDSEDRGYLDVTQAMLSKGLLRISDHREFQSKDVAAEMLKREQEAREKKVGIWADRRSQ